MYMWNSIQDCHERAAFNKKTCHQQTGLKLKEESSKVVHLEQNFVSCWNLNTPESRSESFDMRNWRRMEEIS